MKRASSIQCRKQRPITDVWRPPLGSERFHAGANKDRANGFQFGLATTIDFGGQHSVVLSTGDCCRTDGYKIDEHRVRRSEDGSPSPAVGSVGETLTMASGHLFICRVFSVLLMHYRLHHSGTSSPNIPLAWVVGKAKPRWEWMVQVWCSLQVPRTMI